MRVAKNSPPPWRPRSPSRWRARRKGALLGSRNWRSGGRLSAHRKIGSGACGEVFEAEHVLTRRVEAVKFLARVTAADSEAEREMLREIELQASLRHPNIALVHNACRTPDGFALVMELVEGEPLSEKLERGRLPLREGGRYVLETLDALEYAHRHRIVHRDVKPANIVVGRDGSVKLTDFGLARPLNAGHSDEPGTLAGSPYYISPEQVLGLEAADGRSDCYSVGVILYEIATGCRPFEGESAFEVMLQHREMVPVPPLRLSPEIGADLNAVILRALEKEPERRFQSAGEFRNDLERVLATANRPVGHRGRWIAAAAMAGLATTAAVLAPVARKARPVEVAAPLEVQVHAPAPAPPPVEIAPEPPSTPPEEVPRVVEVPHKKPAPKQRKKLVDLTPKVIQTESERPVVELPAAPPVPAAPTLPPETTPAPKLPDVVTQSPARPATATPEPAKRPGLLRRTFGKIAH